MLSRANHSAFRLFNQRICAVELALVCQKDTATYQEVQNRNIVAIHGRAFARRRWYGQEPFVEFFGNEIIGEDYFYVVGDNRELYGNFNSQFEAKLLFMVEEASSRENHSNHDILKSKITTKKQYQPKRHRAVSSDRLHRLHFQLQQSESITCEAGKSTLGGIRHEPGNARQQDIL